nr:choice-of-anchor J domain-containing protein [uncultured Flavobacterium sp.]
MKRILLTGAFLMALSFTANAQLLSETFNAGSTTISNWSLIDNDGDTKNWGIYTGDEESDSWGFEGNFAGSYSWAQNIAYEPDNFLISPGFTVPDNGATLSYLTGYTYYSPQSEADWLSVYVVTPDMQSVDDIIANDPIYTNIFDTPTTATYVPEAIPVSVSLADYAGEVIALAFRHYNGYDQELVMLDSVLVTAGVNGVADNKFTSLTLSPNPTNSVVNIANAGLVSNVSVVDLNGRVVKSSSFANVENPQVNISDLANGVYMMTINSDKGAVTKKIVKN